MADTPSAKLPFEPLPPEKAAQVAASTILIKRKYGGLDAAGGGVNGSGVVVANSGGRIVTNEHVVRGNVQNKDYYKEMDHVEPDGTVRPPEIEVFTPDGRMIGKAEIVAEGGTYINGRNASVESDQSVLRITEFAPGMEEEYKKLGIPIAKTQSESELRFRLADTTSLKHGNSGGPAVDMQGELIGLNTDTEPVTVEGRLLWSIGGVSPMSNALTLNALGEAGKEIKTLPPNGKPVRAEMHGYRSNSIYTYGAELYPLDRLQPNAAPPVTSDFAASAKEVTRPGHPIEPLPRDPDVYTAHMISADTKSWLSVGHDDKTGQTFVNYQYENHHEVVLYFQDSDRRIIPWLNQQRYGGPKNYLDRLLGDNRDGHADIAQLYTTLKKVSVGGPVELPPEKPLLVIAEAPVPQTAPDPPLQPPQPADTGILVATAATPALPPPASAQPAQAPAPLPSAPPPLPPTPLPLAPSAAPRTTPHSPAPLPVVPPKPPARHNAPHTHVAARKPRNHHAISAAAAKAADTGGSDYLNGIEHDLHNPDEVKTPKDQTYLAAEKILMARHEEIDPDLIAARQKAAPHTSNLNDIKKLDHTDKTRLAAQPLKSPQRTTPT